MAYQLVEVGTDESAVDEGSEGVSSSIQDVRQPPPLAFARPKEEARPPRLWNPVPLKPTPSRPSSLPEAFAGRKRGRASFEADAADDSPQGRDVRQAAQKRQAGEQVYWGLVRSYNPARRSGFIYCPDVKASCGQDVYVFENVLHSGVAGPGDVVAFFIHVSNKGLPQASHPMLRLRCFVDGAYALSGVFKRGSLGYGFIESDVVKAFFGRDVYVHKDLACSVAPGQRVSFNVVLNAQGMPNASDMAECGRDWSPIPPDLSQQVDLAPEEVWAARAQVKVQGAEGHTGSELSSRLPGSARPVPSGMMSSGFIKSFNDSNNYGFIDCEEVKALYGCDTFMHGREFVGHYVGETVQFEVGLSLKGQPQAINVRSLTDGCQQQEMTPPPHKRQRLDTGRRTSPAAPGQALMVLSGTVISVFPESECGFIDCKPVRERFGHDVFVTLQVLAQSLAGPGDLVAFGLSLSDDQKPQAANLLRLKCGTPGFALKGVFKTTANGHCFVECEEVKTFLDRDVYVGKEIASKLAAGSTVSFNAVLNREGKPNVSDAAPSAAAQSSDKTSWHRRSLHWTDQVLQSWQQLWLHRLRAGTSLVWLRCVPSRQRGHAQELERGPDGHLRGRAKPAGKASGGQRAAISRLKPTMPWYSTMPTTFPSVDIQERHVRHTTEWLVAKNQEIEAAVNDMLGTIVAFPLDAHVRRISESEIIKVKAHYNWSMYQSLLAATKRSLHKVKERLSARPLEDGSTPPAFFEVELQLDGLGVCLQPSMEDIQSAINGGAVALLKCSKMIEAWDTVTIPSTVQLLLNPNLPPVSGTGAQGTFYDRVAQDKEILKVVLLLTGSIQSARDGKNKYLKQFERWSWLWNCDIDEEYKKFRASEPTLDEFEAKLRSFARLDDEFQLMEPRRQISALSLQAGSLARSLRELAGRWKESFARELHTQAFHRLEALSEVIKSTMKKLSREVADGDIDALGHVMRTLREVREKQGEIELELEPVAQMYAMLDSYLPNILDKEEQDARSMLQSSRLLSMRP
eukprot:s629_g5.t1